jgi:hypothetical protein
MFGDERPTTEVPISVLQGHDERIAVFWRLEPVDDTVRCKSGESFKARLRWLVAGDLILLWVWAMFHSVVLAFTSAYAASFGEQVGREEVGGDS